VGETFIGAAKDDSTRDDTVRGELGDLIHTGVLAHGPRLRRRNGVHPGDELLPAARGGELAHGLS
jgi:hypothetical protein